MRLRRIGELNVSHMNLKRRRLLIWLLVLVCVLVGVVVLAWHTTLFAQHSTIKTTSPDARYVATVRTAFPLFGGYVYNIEVRRSDGVVISHLVVHDKVVGWGRDPSITWATDSRTVTLGFQDGDTDGGPPIASKRLSIDVH